MTLELFKTLLFFLTGAFLVFLAITITRDNFANRLNRVTGAMLLFAGLGPVFIALGKMVDPITTSPVAFEDTTLYALHYAWEFFFPLLLLFSWIFPVDRLSGFRRPRLRYIIFLPYVMHLIIVLFFDDLIDFFGNLSIETSEEGFASIVTQPFARLISWLHLLLSFVRSYDINIFGAISIVYVITASYFLETGRKFVTNPRLITQTKVVLWGTRVGLGLLLIAHLGSTVLPYTLPETLKSALMILSVAAAAGLLIFATIRYQFLDVRLIFRQSFIYSITSAILVGLYIIIVIKSKQLLEPVFGEQAEIVSYAFIILVLLFFQPINHWVDEFIRSLFIRTRTDHRNVLERFSRQVISLFDPSKLRNIINETLKTTLLVEKVFFVLYDDKVKEYALLISEDNARRVVISRSDLMLRGINLLDTPTYFYSLADYREGSNLAGLLEERLVKLILPMKDADHLLGFVALTDKAAGYSYSSEDLNLLGVLSNQMVTALINARLYVESLERIRLQEEVTMARQIQLDLLPSKPPELVCAKISAHSTPSRTVGGDFFDFLTIDNNRVGIVIADASGKGMPAALMIAQTQAILRSEVCNGNPIDIVLKNMNQLIADSSSAEKYVTLFYGEFDTVSGRFCYSNAGHNYPILARANGSLELLTAGGPVIGALPQMVYQSATVQLEKDDVLFFFTDGLSEAMNEIEEEYTEERVRRYVQDHRSEEPQALIDMILKDMRDFDPTYPPRDDTTIVALKIHNGFKVYDGQA
ncbi:MAG: SpoIIE family protein phosphatase [Candidatus Zixiibacteriota bacterium]|nr:MAG: SpoIIE family protein phosphatase [candidate division Zixibacteria bacterium]